MSEPPTPPCTTPGNRIALIRRVGVDDWADVRYVHAAAYRLLGGSDREPAEIEAFIGFIRSQEYIDRLQSENLYGAWLNDELVGTAGWSPADDGGILARIASVFVRPLFTRMGIGRDLVLNAEGRASAAGFAHFSTRAPANAVGFFEKLGYDVTSHGVHTNGNAHSIPITYMRKHCDDDGGSRSHSSTKTTPASTSV